MLRCNISELYDWAMENPNKVVRLSAAHREQVLELFSSLGKEAVHSRFGYAPSPYALEQYVSGLDFEGSALLGIFKGTRLVGLCEVVPLGELQMPGVFELAFAVHPDYQGSGLGRLLGEAALHREANLIALCVVPNQPMSRLAKKLGLSSVPRAQVELSKESGGSWRSAAADCYSSYASPSLLACAA